MQLFESTEENEFQDSSDKRLTRQRNDVEYAALIEQQLKRSLKS